MNNERLIKAIAKKYIRWLEFDDLMQAGHLGILKGKRKYVPKEGVREETYMSSWIACEMRKAIAAQRGAPKRQANNPIFSQTLDVDDFTFGYDAQVPDMYPHQMEKLLAGLPKHEEQALRLTFSEGKEASTAAKELGISKSLMSLRMKTAVERLQWRVK